MRKDRSFRVWGAVLAIAAVAVFAAAALQSAAQAPPRIPPPRPEIAKIRPIVFEIAQESPLTKNCAAKVESDNALLATMLGEMRFAMASDKPFDRAAWEKRMAVTYLKNPVITTEGGEPVAGWASVFDVLAGIIGKSTYIDAQSVRVTLDYLPFKSPEYSKHNAASKPGEEIDFVAQIRTVLAYAPQDDPVTIAGALLHSKVCPWRP